MKRRRWTHVVRPPVLKNDSQCKKNDGDNDHQQEYSQRLLAECEWRIVALVSRHLTCSKVQFYQLPETYTRYHSDQEKQKQHHCLFVIADRFVLKGMSAHRRDLPSVRLKVYHKDECRDQEKVRDDAESHQDRQAMDSCRMTTSFQARSSVRE